MDIACGTGDYFIRNRASFDGACGHEGKVADSELPKVIGKIMYFAEIMFEALILNRLGRPSLGYSFWTRINV